MTRGVFVVDGLCENRIVARIVLVVGGFRKNLIDYEQSGVPVPLLQNWPSFLLLQMIRLSGESRRA